MKRSDFLIIAGMVLGYWFIEQLPPWPDIEADQRELTAYRHCMQSAGKTRCQMTPQDFVRYYELKYQLEIEEQAKH